MKPALDVAETVVNIAGITVAVQDMESILSIILLSISILSLLIRGGYLAYKHFKAKKCDEGIKTIVDTLDKAKDTIEKYKDGNKK